MDRKLLIRIFTFLGGIYFFLEYLLPETIGTFQFNRYNDQITQGFMAVTAMTFGLGLINILYIHGSKILFVRKGWVNSAGLLLGLVMMLWVTGRDWSGSNMIGAEARPYQVLASFAKAISGDFNTKKDLPARSVERLAVLRREIVAKISAVADPVVNQLKITESEQARFQALLLLRNESLQKLQLAITSIDEQSTLIGKADSKQEGVVLDLTGVESALQAAGQSQKEIYQYLYQFSFDASLYKLLYDGFFVALGSAMFSLLGFYMAAAAYRAFRIRSYESALMMLSAVIVMLGQIPFGLWIWDGFTDLRLWLLSTPSTAAFRAVKLGAAVAGLVMAFRMWLSIETDSFSNDSGSKR